MNTNHVNDERVLINLSWLLQQVGLDYSSNYLRVIDRTPNGEYIVNPGSQRISTLVVPQSAIWG